MSSFVARVVAKEHDPSSRDQVRIMNDSLIFFIFGRRKRGRPRETWRRMIEAKMKTMGKTWKELETTAKDREQWKSLVSPLCAT